MKFLAILLSAASCALAGEYAILASGARLYAERHELDGEWICLYTNSGTTRIPASLVEAWEREEPIPLPPAATSVPVEAPVLDIHKLIDQAAAKHGLPKEFLHSVVAAESAYRRDAVSSKGAIGVMQLMPRTAKAYGADPHDPQQNIDAGTRYLRDLLLKYDHGVFSALAAYNAGPGAVAKHKGVPPYRETQAYVSRIYRNYLRKKQLSTYGNP